jgi:hypothetical protein
MVDERHPAGLLAQPVIVLGVPRSGTTLLRVLLGMHPEVVAAPETPWITGGYGPVSLRAVADDLVEHPTGPVANLPGVDRATVVRGIRALVLELLRGLPAARPARRLVLKTPDDAPHVGFLAELFPGARFLHICRDGRDVAASTVAAAGLGPRLAGFGKRTAVNAARRWAAWETELREQSRRREEATLDLCYRELVTEPLATLDGICSFLGLPFDKGMLRYDAVRGELLPAWEVGAQDVVRRERIDASRIGRWREVLSRDEMLEIDRACGDALVRLGYARCFDEVDPPPTPAERLRYRLRQRLPRRWRELRRHRA